MPDVAAFLPSIAIGLVLVVMLWFALGTQRNIRIGNDHLRWLQAALPLVGRRTTLRWLGSSAVELRIADAHDPFRDATILVVLEPRDVGLLWGWARLRGRRDMLIVRANLRRAPRTSVAVADPRAWTGRLDDDTAGWRRLAWPPKPLEGRASGPAGADEQAIRTAWTDLERATGGVWRLVVQPVVPHLEVHLRPPGREAGADRVLRPLKQLAEALSRPA